MRSLFTIAELAWRQFNPRPSDEVKNTLEEYIESAKDAYAGIVWTQYMRTQSGDEKSIYESLLTVKKYPINYDGEMPTIELDISVVDLPRDAGITRVKPDKPGCEAMTKTSISAQDIFSDDPGPKQYYRAAQTLYFPKGFDCGKPKSVEVVIVSAGNVDKDMLIPDSFADAVRQRLVDIYGRVNAKEDNTNNQNADV